MVSRRRKGAHAATSSGTGPGDTNTVVLAKPRPSRKRRIAQWTAGIVGGTTFFAAATFGGAVYYEHYVFNKIKKVHVTHLHTVAAGQPFNVLVVGSDSRVGLTPAEERADGSADLVGGQRSDVVMIWHVVPATHRISILSIPRDLLVYIASPNDDTGTENRINSAYNNGPGQLVQTIEVNFGIQVSHVIQVDFNGFEDAVNALGGVHMYFPYPARDNYSQLDITSTGCQLLNGAQALAVARSRHFEYFYDGYWQYDPASDFSRIHRQDAFLRSMISAAESKYNPLTLNAFILAATKGLVIDDTFTASDLLSLGEDFHSFGANQLLTYTLPTYSDGYYESFGDVLFIQEPQAEDVISQWLGSPAPKAEDPPPTPSGSPTYVPPTTTTIPGATTTTSPYQQPTTTTTIATFFDPTPC